MSNEPFTEIASGPGMKGVRVCNQSNGNDKIMVSVGDGKRANVGLHLTRREVMKLMTALAQIEWND